MTFLVALKHLDRQLFKILKEALIDIYGDVSKPNNR